MAVNSNRADKKLIYSQLMIDELLSYDRHHSNNDWENAHQEAVLYHLSGAVDAFLHEINIAYELGFTLFQVTFQKIKEKLCSTNQSSSAFLKINELRGKNDSWLSLLYEMRNHGAHRARVGKLIQLSSRETMTPIGNEFKDPRTGEPQTVYPGINCEDLLFQFKSDVEIYSQNVGELILSSIITMSRLKQHICNNFNVLTNSKRGRTLH